MRAGYEDNRERRSERGAVLVHIAIAMVALMAFCALVIDYGIFWAARRQAQNSADAAALAGAIALAFDDPSDFSTDGAAQQNARAAALANLVWGQQPSIVLGNRGTTPADVTFPVCPDSTPDRCVRVNVYRYTGTHDGAARNNPLPTFFGRLVGINTQDVKATATAQVLSGNATTCLKPFAVADKWDEYDMTDGIERESDMTGTGPNGEDYFDPDFYEGPPGSQTFDKYDSKNPEDDYYEPHGPDSLGTGWRIFEDETQQTMCCDYGREIRLKGAAQDQISAGWFAPLRIDCPGGSCYREAISGCSGITQAIGDEIFFDTEPGNMIGPTRQGVEDLIAQDPDAQWYPPGSTLPEGAAENQICVQYGCVYSPIYGVNNGPRVGAFPVFNVDEYLAAGPAGMESIAISNLIGIFIVDVTGGGNNQEVIGRLVTLPGDIAAGGTVDNAASFLLTIRLVR